MSEGSRFIRGHVAPSLFKEHEDEGRCSKGRNTKPEVGYITGPRVEAKSVQVIQI